AGSSCSRSLRACGHGAMTSKPLAPSGTRPVSGSNPTPALASTVRGQRAALSASSLVGPGGGYRRWNAGGKRGVYTHCVNTGRQGEHPTEKPVPLMCEIIGDFTRPGELICDPFMGSGTTGAAALSL